MKQHNIDNWEDFPEKDALLLFAQRFEECLFDYSLDSYKARALNTRTRCVELKDYIQQVQKASLSNNVLIPVVEELAESIQKDEVARSLLSHKAEYLGRKSEWEGASLQQIETQVDLALTVLADTYEERLINHLKMLIEDGRRKKDIISATGDLVVEWMSKGYSSDYLFYQVRMYFYYDDRHIDSVECFDEFVERFQHQTSEWTVIIRANENIGVLADLFDDESSVSVVGDAPEAQTESTQERGFLRKEHDGVYVIIDGVESLDASAAHSLADSQLEALVSIARYHIHREPFEWEDGGLVYDEDGDPTRLQGSTPPIEKHPECYLEELPDEYRATLEAFGPQKLDWESWQRLARVLRLHGSAVRSDSAEGQLFSLWTALESLLPLTKFESRIDQTVDSIKPLLCRGVRSFLCF